MLVAHQLGLIAALLIGASCTARDRSGTEPAPPASVSAAPELSGTAPQATNEAPPTREILAELELCDVRHRGLSIDLGTPMAHGLAGFRIDPDPAGRDVDREGATFTRIRDKRAKYDFWIDSPRTDQMFVSLRLHPLGARRVSALLDDHPIGSARLTPDMTAIVTLPTTRLELEKGRHTLQLRFAGSGAAQAMADVDWIRVGIADDLAATYAAPTQKDILTSLEIDGKPRRSLVLRAPSSVRCPFLVANAAQLRVSLGFWGTGKGTAEIRVARDGEAPITLMERKVLGGSGAQWLPIEVDLSAFAGQIIGLELRAVDAVGGGRVVFGEPVIGRAKETARRTAPTDTAVLVVLSSLDRRRIPPWGPVGELSALAELGRAGVAFGNYRIPTTVPGAVFASLLTGRQPRAHRLEDPSARLTAPPRNLGEVVKASGGLAALFTAVPTSFAAFGFSEGWDRFESYSPVADVPATESFDQAAKWIEQAASAPRKRKRLLVVYGRGMHPPWDLSKEEVAKLPPEEYGGSVDARRGAVILGHLRALKDVRSRRLTDEEWTRVKALEDAAMVKQVTALGRLIDALKRTGTWDESLFVVVGDTGLAQPPRLPFDAAGPLTEDRLVAPLLVKFPGGQLGGLQTDAPALSVDIPRTILGSLGLDEGSSPWGRDLFSLAAQEDLPIGRALVATLGTTYATRLGTWLLSGEQGKVPHLCQLDVDPACVNDALNEKPIAGAALWRWTHQEEMRSRNAVRGRSEREPASLDPETAAALTVWGDLR